MIVFLVFIMAALACSSTTVTPQVVNTVTETKQPQTVATNTPEDQPIIVPTIQPTSTSLVMLEMDMGQFVAKYESMTDLQKKDFIGKSIGKWVDWSGAVYEVDKSGSITIDGPSSFSLIFLSGVSKDIGITLSKGQEIHFTGRITDIYEFFGLTIDIGDGQLLP